MTVLVAVALIYLIFKMKVLQKRTDRQNGGNVDRPNNEVTTNEETPSNTTQPNFVNAGYAATFGTSTMSNDLSTISGNHYQRPPPSRSMELHDDGVSTIIEGQFDTPTMEIKTTKIDNDGTFNIDVDSGPALAVSSETLLSGPKYL